MHRKKFIAICVPSLGAVSIEWASVLRGMAWPLNTGYINLFVKDDQGGEIAEARNRCVQLALDRENETTEITHLFWLDDDVITSTRALLKLFCHQRDIASGCYWLKEEPSQALIFPGRFCGTTPFVPDKVFETWGWSHGLSLVRTSVYRTVQEKLNPPRDKYGRTEFYRTCGAEEGKLVEAGILDMGGTEDMWFFDLCGRAGFRPIMDTSCQCFGWHMNLGTQKAFPAKQWEQRCSGKPIVWDTPDGPVEWK